jgi:hypothetical protein
MFDLETPTYFDPCPRIVVIGDVHGDLARLMECLYATNVLNKNGEWVAEPPNTIVVQLGDQVDSKSRGSAEDWERLPDTEVVLFMDRLDRVARMKGGRVLSLIGNHELMNVMGDFSYVSEKYVTQHRAAQFQPGGSLAQILAKRCVVMKIGSVLFAHAGLLPQHIEHVHGDLHVYNELIRKYLRGEKLNGIEETLFVSDIIGERGIVWNRFYMDNMTNMHVIENVLGTVLANTGSTMMCIGHNTVASITGVMHGKLWFVDTGLSRAYGTRGFQVLEILDDGTNFRVSEIRL